MKNHGFMLKSSENLSLSRQFLLTRLTCPAYMGADDPVFVCGKEKIPLNRSSSDTFSLLKYTVCKLQAFLHIRIRHFAYKHWEFL